MAELDQAELTRVLGLARELLSGQLEPRDAATAISAPVDPGGGPASLSTAYWDLYMPFYGPLVEWQDAEGTRDSEQAIPLELIAAYQQDLLDAARKLVESNTAPS